MRQILHVMIGGATHTPHLTSLSLSIRHDISLGFEAEPYGPEVRGRALPQHPVLTSAGYRLAGASVPWSS